MSTHTTARLVRAGRGILTTEDGVAVFTALGPDLDANEARLIAIWSSHDQIVAENVALREQLAALSMPDPVREQLVAALKALRKWADELDADARAEGFGGGSVTAKKIYALTDAAITASGAA